MMIRELELKVIQLAIAQRYAGLGSIFDDSPLARAVDALIAAREGLGVEDHSWPCPGCIQGDEDPAPWCDCRDDETCKGPCRRRAHEQNRCPNLPWHCDECNAGGHTCPGDGNPIPHGASDCGEHEEEDEGYARTAKWTPATWGQVVTGDRVRLGVQEAEVYTAVRLNWHADNSDPYRPKPWEHSVMRVRLTHLADVLNFPAGDPVEILADAGRRAELALSAAFPGTVVIESGES